MKNQFEIIAAFVESMALIVIQTKQITSQLVAPYDCSLKLHYTVALKRRPSPMFTVIFSIVSNSNFPFDLTAFILIIV